MISLNYRDSRPIYEQIRDGLRKLIVTGALSADEKLPSVRALAAQLAINPNTIQRAYMELEQQGLEIKDVRFQRMGANCEKIILGLEDHMEYSQKKIGDLMSGINGVKFFKILS